jgi:hypothetical protein
MNRSIVLGSLFLFAVASCGPSEVSIVEGEEGADEGVSRLVTAQEAAASAARVAALDGSKFGLNSHAGPPDLLEKFAQIDLRWHRVDGEWQLIETADGVYDWTINDQAIAAAERLNLKLMTTISYAPRWASGGTTSAAPPRDPARFIKFVREFTRRYRGKFGCMGIWNEPNLKQFWSGGKSQFINDILVPGLRAIRQEAPEQALCGPDLSSAGNEREDWMKPILASEAGALFDIITHHQYDGNDTVSGRVAEIDRMRTYIAARGQANKPLWITEIGWPTQAKQVQMLPGVMAAMNSRPWWTKTFWYDSHGGGWGLVGPDGASDRGTLYPSYFTYRDVIAAAAPVAPPVAPPAPTSPSPAPVPAGLQVALATFNGHYVTAELGGGQDLNATRTELGVWQLFTVVDLNGGTLMSGDSVVFRTWDGTHLITALNAGGGAVKATASYADIWETFRITRLAGPGPVSLNEPLTIQSWDGHYVAAESGGGSTVVANRNAPGPWEQFTFRQP